MGLHWKIQLLGGEFTKKLKEEGLPKKGARTVCRFKDLRKEGLARKTECFEGGWYPGTHYAKKFFWKLKSVFTKIDISFQIVMPVR